MSTQEEQKNLTPDFQKEIKCMMYSFGGSRQPYLESVMLVEDITHSQISEMITKATEVSRLRGKRTMSVEDIFFLLRKNKDKLRALLRHLQTKDMAKSIKAMESSGGGCNPPPLKKRKYSIDFLNQSDQAIVESSAMDLHSIQALERMDEITRDMDRTEYMYYTQCRQANFHKNTTKFVEWLELSSLTDFKLSQEVIEVFGYLAYETVREIVELALRVKEDTEKGDLLRPCHSHHHHQSTSAQPQFGTTPTFFTVPISATTGSPLPSPSPPQERSPSPSPGSSDDKHKRRQIPVTLALHTTTSHLDRDGGRAIHPKHIREAMRRYQYDMGPTAPLTTHFSKLTFYKRTLCT